MKHIATLFPLCHATRKAANFVTVCENEASFNAEYFSEMPEEYLSEFIHWLLAYSVSRDPCS
jgi:hypothetical protein